MACWSVVTVCDTVVSHAQSSLMFCSLGHTLEIVEHENLNCDSQDGVDSQTEMAHLADFCLASKSLKSLCAAIYPATAATDICVAVSVCRPTLFMGDTISCRRGVVPSAGNGGTCPGFSDTSVCSMCFNLSSVFTCLFGADIAVTVYSASGMGVCTCMGGG